MTYDQKIAAIIVEIAPILKTTFDPAAYAAGMLDESGGDNHFEIRALHTKNGAAHTFRIGE